MAVYCMLVESIVLLVWIMIVSLLRPEPFSADNDVFLSFKGLKSNTHLLPIAPLEINWTRLEFNIFLLRLFFKKSFTWVSNNNQTENSSNIVHRHKKFQATSYHYHYHIHIHRKSNRFILFLPPFPCLTSFALSSSTAPLSRRTIDSSIESISTVIPHFAASSTPTTKSSSKYFIVW
jgi:hypothetical protein